MSLTPLLGLQFWTLGTTMMPFTVLAHMRICALLILALSYLSFCRVFFRTRFGRRSLSCSFTSGTFATLGHNCIKVESIGPFTRSDMQRLIQSQPTNLQVRNPKSGATGCE